MPDSSHVENVREDGMRMGSAVLVILPVSVRRLSTQKWEACFVLHAACKVAVFRARRAACKGCQACRAWLGGMHAKGKVLCVHNAACKGQVGMRVEGGTQHAACVA